MLEEITNLGISQTEAKELIKVSKNINDDLKMLKQGYPIQYLIGYVNFYGNKINVNENVLIPRYETEGLVEKTINYLKSKRENSTILDIGTGSGAISIALKKEITSLKVTGCDISIKALEVAEDNAKNNHVDIDFIKSDIFSNIKSKFDVIISNPPYISENESIEEIVKKYEPNIALFAKNNGLYFYEEIIKEASKYLNNGGLICFEIGSTQAEDIILIAKKYLTNYDISIGKDLSNKNRYAYILMNKKNN